jgi:hypothetical protein
VVINSGDVMCDRKRPRLRAVTPVPVRGRGVVSWLVRERDWLWQGCDMGWWKLTTVTQTSAVHWIHVFQNIAARTARSGELLDEAKVTFEFFGSRLEDVLHLIFSVS